MTIKQLIIELNDKYVAFENQIDEIKIILKDLEKTKDQLGEIITGLEDDGINA